MGGGAPRSKTRRQAGPRRNIKPAEVRAPGRSLPILLRAAGITLVGVLIYWNSLSAPFTFGDGPSIIDNTQIRRLCPLSQALSPPSKGQPVAGRPLVNLSFARSNWALKMPGCTGISLIFSSIGGISREPCNRPNRPCASRREILLHTDCSVSR